MPMRKKSGVETVLPTQAAGRVPVEVMLTT
jgi:hypothetical protein